MRVITVGSGKGGTGKSFVAANLGLALAHRGVRTCVVDLDFGSADVHLLLGQLQPRQGVLDVLRGHALSLADVMTPSKVRGLSLVPGAGETVRAGGLSAREIEHLSRGIRDLPVEAAIIDLPAGVAHQVLDLFLAGDTQLLVTTPDPVAVTDTVRFLRLARVRRAARSGANADVPRRPRVYTSLDDLVRDMNAIRTAEMGGGGHAFQPLLVLNRCPASPDRHSAELVERLRSEVGEDIELRLEAEIPEDPAVGRSVRMLAPVLELAPGAPASRIINELASTLVPAPTGEGWIPAPERGEPLRV